MSEVLKTQEVKLDLKRVTAQPQSIQPLTVGDNGNVFIIELTDDGVAVDLQGCNVLAVFSRADGETAEQDVTNGLSVVDNVITIRVRTESFAHGQNKCELQIYSGESHSTLVTSASFNFDGKRAIFNDDTIQSQDSFPILTTLIKQTEEALDTANEAIDEANDASDRADAAAGNANTAATSANAAASAANSAASEANAAASEASTSATKADIAVIGANRATENANTAAARANDAADRIEESGGVGDMTKAVYDTDGDGVVNEAAVARNARLFDDLPVANFAMVSDLNQRSPKFVTTTVTLPVSGWSGNAQRVSCSIAKADNIVFVSPAAASFDDYGEAGVRCTIQSAGYLTFACKETPAASIVVNVVAEGSV